MTFKKLTIDNYEITKDGRVINKNTNHELKPQKNGKGTIRDVRNYKIWKIKNEKNS